MSERCDLKGCGKEAVIGTSKVWGPEYKVAMCESHVMERIRRIADLQAQVEQLTQERDDARRQMAATVEALRLMLSAAPQNIPTTEGMSLFEANKIARAVLADLPAAAQEIATKLERAEKLAEALRRRHCHLPGSCPSPHLQRQPNPSCGLCEPALREEGK